MPYFVVVCLIMLLVSRFVKGVEGNNRGHFLGTNLAIAWRDNGKEWNISVRIVSVLVKIEQFNLSGTSKKHYCLSQNAWLWSSLEISHSDNRTTVAFPAFLMCGSDMQYKLAKLWALLHAEGLIRHATCDWKTSWRLCSQEVKNIWKGCDTLWVVSAVFLA
jgi:hypothetical protein